MFEVVFGMIYVLYAVFGLIAGVVGGMGMGGGTVLIPLLSFLGTVPQHVAQAVNLITFIPMAVVAIFFHIKNKLIDFSGILYIILPGVAFAAGFSYIAENTSGDILQRIFGGFLIVLSVLQIFSNKIVKSAKD